MNMIAALLICCSLPLNTTSQTPLVCGENQTRPDPQNIGESRAKLDTRLPWYTSGFE